MAQIGIKRGRSVILGAEVKGCSRLMAISLIALIAFIGSCANTPPKLYTNYKTSMIRFLGPDENTIKNQEAMEPTITVPLKVGFASRGFQPV